MDPYRWARVKEVFQAARDCDPGRRQAYLLEACAGDSSLREAVETMLADEAGAASFLEAPALEVEAMAVARGLAGRGSSAQSCGLVGIPAEPAAASPVRASWRRPSARPPWWILALAAVFLADFLLKTWCLAFGPEPLGYGTRVEEGRYVVASVTPLSPADRAGMRPGDILASRDGQPYDRVAVSRVTHPNLEVGQELRFEIERDGQRRQLSMSVRRAHEPRDALDINLLWQAAAGVMLATAVLIGVKRPRDAVARMGALTLATLAVGLYRFNLPGGYAVAWRSVPWALGALLWIPNVCIALIGPIGLGFFARFPRPLFRARWLWGLIWLPTLCTAPADLYTLFLRIYHPAMAHLQPGLAWTTPASAGLFGLYGLAMLAAIAANYVRLTDIREKRRLRVLIAGGGVGTLPALVRFVARGFAEGSRLFDFLMSGVPDILIAVFFLLFPLSFAYAVLKHRILGVGVIVRTGVQYALAKGLAISLVPALGALLVVDALVHGDQPLIEIVRARGSVYATLAALAVVAHTQRRRMSRAIDRRFFQEHYDASRLLREVAEQARRAGSLERAGPPVVARIEAALHPECAVLLVRPSAEAEFRCIAAAPSGLAPPAISRDHPAVVRLRATERPLELGTRGTGGLEPDGLGEKTDAPHPPHVELMVPIVMDPSRHEALLALGAKRSEEPYTREDLDSLTAIASSLALLLEGPTPVPDRAGSAFEECPCCGSCYDSGASRCTNEQAELVPVGMPRTLAGRYHLEQRLGRGGMGKVYEAVDVALDRRVAVKVIRDEWVHSASAAARFRREARAVAGFGHPNVVTVYDYGVEPGSRAFLVMELLQGATLREELRRSGRLDGARTLEVFRGVCGAMDAAHRHHLVHRDLKPENIFLVGGGGRDGDGVGTTVKVLDFGVAKPLPGSDEALEADGTPETETGVMVGTVGYLSPEQLLGERPDVSWDLWALAVVAYESLTAALPFPVASRETWRQSVLTGRYTPLGEHLVDPPARLQQFFDCAFSVDRALRPRSAAEFLHDLESALA